ncbi:hypothetical protein B0T10DRAFT_468080 [Thelonectria olida]|uniref:Uncharacterized protein n=1 Tax=Thelonectria olida TaxID=1576542 RepID=A0A9P9ADM8_9HYPO|nr:hypothetical protein B0T10DRAFT_468080 [Thelonectria olida]
MYKQAEADLNTYQAKTGNGRSLGLDNAGVDSSVEQNFNNGQIEQGDELSTNRGYNKRIRPSEGSVVDDRGCQARGGQYEGEGGPGDKISQSYQEQGGQNDNDVEGARISATEGLGSGRNIMREGQEATRANVGANPPGPGGSTFKGDDYYVPKGVPDITSAEGLIPPESVTQSSREAENP